MYMSSRGSHLLSCIGAFVAGIVLDLFPLWSSWSLVFMGVQMTKCSHASLVSEKMYWSVDLVAQSSSQSLDPIMLIAWFTILIPVANSFAVNTYVTTTCPFMHGQDTVVFMRAFFSHRTEVERDWAFSVLDPEQRLCDCDYVCIMYVV